MRSMSASIKLNDESEPPDVDEQLRQAAAERNCDKVKSLLQKGAGKTAAILHIRGRGGIYLMI